MSNKISLWLFAAVLLFCAVFAHSQTSVVLSPFPYPFLDSSGRPLAFGCVFSYQTNTSNPLPTYSDYTGQYQNPNPVLLNAAGRANIWLQAGQSYTLIVKSAGGSNCSLGTTQYTVDGLGGGSTQLTSVVTPVGGSATFPVLAQNQLFTLTLTGNVTGQTITAVGVVPPAFIAFQITQDLVGGHSFSWPSNAIGGALVGSTANQTTTQMFLWNGTNATAIGPAVLGNGPLTQVGNGFFSVAANSPAFISSFPNPALSGIFRLGNNQAVAWRNNANSADLQLIKQTDDNLYWPNGLSLGGGSVLATTNQTGTGSIVMSNAATITSPSLVTPSLGVATATSFACGSATKSTNYTLTTSDCIILANAAGGSFTLTLPHAATAQMWMIARIDNSANTVTLAPDSGSINGQSSTAISGFSAWNCTSSGTNIFCNTSPGGQSQWVSVSGGCVSNGATCTTNGTWGSPFVDSSYKILCQPTSEIGNPQGAFFWVSTKTASGFVITTDNRGTTNPGGWGSWDCQGYHP